MEATVGTEGEGKMWEYFSEESLWGPQASLQTSEFPLHTVCFRHCLPCPGHIAGLLLHSPSEHSQVSLFLGCPLHGVLCPHHLAMCPFLSVSTLGSNGSNFVTNLIPSLLNTASPWLHSTLHAVKKIFIDDFPLIFINVFTLILNVFNLILPIIASRSLTTWMWGPCLIRLLSHHEAGNWATGTVERQSPCFWCRPKKVQGTPQSG